MYIQVCVSYCSASYKSEIGRVSTIFGRPTNIKWFTRYNSNLNLFKVIYTLKKEF